MRPAPAVTVRCAGARPWRALQAGLSALAAAAFSAWAFLHAGAAPVWALAAAGLCAAGLSAALWRAGSAPAGRLCWDGREWSVDGQPGRVQLMLDLGSLMVLRQARGRFRARWLAVATGEAGVHGHALRSALYARAPGDAAAPRPSASA